jgi:hypothetical protein
MSNVRGLVGVTKPDAEGKITVMIDRCESGKRAFIRDTKENLLALFQYLIDGVIREGQPIPGQEQAEIVIRTPVPKKASS